MVFLQIILLLQRSITVIKIEKQIKPDNDNIKDVDIAHPIEARRYFINDTEHIARNNDNHKSGTFPFDNLCPQTFDNGYWPSKGKT
jgi:hypothetical protein